MTATETKKAIWTPSWYEMDQSIAVGVKGKFRFFQENPPLVDCPQDYDFVFYNQLDSDSDSLLRFACIVEIYHPTLGPLSRIDTDGFDYIFTPVNGEGILVNAEEKPGKTYDDCCQVDDWSVLVTLNEVSENVADVV